MRIVLSKIIYRCDIQDMFRSTAQHAKHDTKTKNKATRETAKTIASEVPRSRTTLHYLVALQRAMKDHFEDALQPRRVYSVPAHLLQCEALLHRLEESLSKKRPGVRTTDFVRSMTPWYVMSRLRTV